MSQNATIITAIRPLIWYGRCPIWYRSSYLYIRPL